VAFGITALCKMAFGITALCKMAFGITALSIVSFGIKTLSITAISITTSALQQNSKQSASRVFMLSVDYFNATLNVVIISVILLKVVAPLWQFTLQMKEHSFNSAKNIEEIPLNNPNISKG
jgi:hypothetical protein